MPVSNATIAKLYEGGRLKQGRTGGGRKRHVWIDTNGELHRGKPPVELLGSFQGNVAPMRRSRKGRTYRGSGGSRYYLAPWGYGVSSYSA